LALLNLAGGTSVDDLRIRTGDSGIDPADEIMKTGLEII
jgi:hypothetical protein